MRFFGYTLGDESAPMAPPTPELMQEMGAFMEEATKAGVIVATGGIGPTSMGAKVTLKDGAFTRRRRAVRRGQGTHRRLGPAGVPRPRRGRRMVEAVHRRGRRGRSPRPSRVRTGITARLGAVVESAA